MIRVSIYEHHVFFLDCCGSLLFLPTCIFHYISFTAVKDMARVLAIPMMRLVEASITLEMIMQAAGLRV